MSRTAEYGTGEAMTADEYVPSDQDMRWQYVVKRMHDGATRTHAEREYTRWLASHDARVRRDAAREALDGLINERRTAHDAAATNNRVGGMVLELHAQQVATNYRDAHYPEPFTWTEAEDARRLQSIADGAADHRAEETP